MRTVRSLFPRLIDPDHLDLAADRTVRGKRRRPDVAWFLLDRGRILRELESGLRAGTWRPRPFERLFLSDPKPRVIARAPVADRVVHTAIALLVQPIVLRSASDGDFACRPGFGTHRALLRLLEHLRRHRFALHLDVRAFFPSLDPALVLRLLARRVRDRAFLSVVERVLDSGRGLYDSRRARRHARLPDDWPPRGLGLPMGAATSQLFATHLVLSAFDHFVKRELRVPGYLRYSDDLFLFGDRRADLRAWRSAVGDYLESRLGLRLKHPQARVLSCAGHLDALGFRIRRSGLEPLPQAWRRVRVRMGDYARGRGRLRGRAALERSLASSAGNLFFP